jgi:hypothetical protein
MIATLILVTSLAALLEFFVSYCRSLLAACAKEELSAQAREVTGIAGRAVSGDQFQKLAGLVRLCPAPSADRNRMRAVGLYFRMLNLLQESGKRIAPAVAGWAERERQSCAYFAAVVLDHRISQSRDLMAQQSSINL